MAGAPARPRASIHANLWLVAAASVAAAVCAPLVALAVAASRGSPDLWEHLFAFVLPSALGQSILLLAGVALVAGVIGTGTAWLVTAYDFPGRRTLDWALLLPLAVPTYIVAYAYLDLLHPVGPIQTGLRALLGIDSPRDFRVPDIRSMPGAILLLGLVLYPYVFLPTRALFLMQTANLIDAARTLGTSRGRIFFHVALPMARPAVAIGLSLTLLEALNDIGASEFLGVRTLTVSIYTTWTTRSDLPGAAQIALAMLAFVVGLVLIERRARRHRGYANDAQHPRPLLRHRLRGGQSVLAALACALPVVLGFLAPGAYLVHATVLRVRSFGIAPALWAETRNTVVVSILATALTLTGGLLVVVASRINRGSVTTTFVRLASLGYAVPGTVLAIGVLPVVVGLDTAIDAVSTRVAGVPTGLLLLSSGAALVYAYTVRFLAVAAGGVEAGFGRISTSLDAAARTLGESAGGMLRRVHIPLTRPALATGALLVFVDCMKELPATLLLRPIGMETLATHLYGEAVRGTYEDAAIAALLIVVAGLIPVTLLARVGR